MTIDRLILTSGTGVTGADFAGSIQDEVTGLWGNSVIPLTDVAGTGDAITATVSPALADGLQSGMNFWLEAAADNTGPATIAIGEEDAVDLVDDDGMALGAALLKEGRLYLLAFDGTAMRVYGTAGQKRVADYQVFTASGTWNKPAGTPDDALVIVEAWGGGGGGRNSTGSTSGGGGGGEYKLVAFRAVDLSASETVTVGAAVSAGVAGNNSSFGSHVTAYGGGRSTGASGGTGGGPFDKGADNGGAAGPSAGLGAAGGSGVTSATGGDGYFGGGGGGGGPAGADGDGTGGRSVYGGGGGGGKNANGHTFSGGTSVFGGAGGNWGAAGSPPGGGGGASAGGARGEVRVRTVG
jgi:hypothetical protein